MRVASFKSAVAGVAALEMLAASSLTTAPAEAAAMMMRPGGFGGFHGAMARPGGFGGFAARPGFNGAFARPGFNGAFVRPGFNGAFAHRNVFVNNGCWRWGCRHGWGWPWWGVGYGVGLAAATYPLYGYDNGCWQLVPVYSSYGSYLGRRWVNVCTY